jgi:predicted nuclease of predicted toxin-antitoxin system
MGTLASELQGVARHLVEVPRVYVDANLPAGLVSAMRHDLAWDVLFVLEDDALRRAPDIEHFHRAFDLGRTLITLDHDFEDDRRFPPELSPGIVVCSAPNERLLLRMLRYIDRVILRAPDAAAQPLRGSKLTLTPEMLPFEP